MENAWFRRFLWLHRSPRRERLTFTHKSVEGGSMVKASVRMRSPPGINALASYRRPMKWGFLADLAPLMGRNQVAQALMPGRSPYQTCRNHLLARPRKDVGKGKPLVERDSRGAFSAMAG